MAPSGLGEWREERPCGWPSRWAASAAVARCRPWWLRCTSPPAPCTPPCAASPPCRRALTSIGRGHAMSGRGGCRRRASPAVWGATAAGAKAFSALGSMLWSLSGRGGEERRRQLPRRGGWNGGALPATAVTARNSTV